MKMHPDCGGPDNACLVAEGRGVHNRCSDGECAYADSPPAPHDEYTGKPYDVDVAHVMAARKLWKKYSTAQGSSERAFIHVVAPVLAALVSETRQPNSTFEDGLELAAMEMDKMFAHDYGAGEPGKRIRALKSAAPQVVPLRTTPNTANADLVRRLRYGASQCEPRGDSTMLMSVGRAMREAADALEGK